MNSALLFFVNRYLGDSGTYRCSTTIEAICNNKSVHKLTSKDLKNTK